MTAEPRPIGPQRADDPSVAYDRPSKSQRKRDMHSLQDLGEQLVALPAHRLGSIPLEEGLREAIDQAQRITSREGRRRQLQLVGKLMRNVDAEPIRRALELLQGNSRAATALLHTAERWRTRLLDSPRELDSWLLEQPNTDRAAFERLIEGAKAELSQGQGGRHFRELFRHLREALASGF